jgi:hypothetical protein
MCAELGQPAQILGDRCQGELVLRTPRSAQPQTAELQDALRMGEKHLDALAIMARPLECVGLGECARDVAGLLVDAARDLPYRLLWAALPLERADAAVALARSVEQLLVIDDRSRGREDFPCGADVDIARLVERELFAA